MLNILPKKNLIIWYEREFFAKTAMRYVRTIGRECDLENQHALTNDNK